MRDRIRQARRLATIARRLAADDPRLAEAFRLWNERCGGVPAARTSGWTAGPGPAAAVVAALRVVLGCLHRR